MNIDSDMQDLYDRADDLRAELSAAVIAGDMLEELRVDTALDAIETKLDAMVERMPHGRTCCCCHCS